MAVDRQQLSKCTLFNHMTTTLYESLIRLSTREMEVMIRNKHSSLAKAGANRCWHPEWLPLIDHKSEREGKRCAHTLHT